MEQVTFSEFYSLMDIAGIIIVEDTIEFDLSRKAIMYDYLMLIDNDKNRIIDNIYSEQTKTKLRKIEEEYAKCKDQFQWHSVPKRDVEYYIRKNNLNELKKAIEDFSEEEVKQNTEVFKRFGLGVKSENATGYNELLEGANHESVSLPIRIYTDFTASELKYIREDLEAFSENNKFFLCVIDNFMKGEARGKEIIDALYNEVQTRKNGICIVLSSQQEEITKNLDDLYVGFVNKAAENINNEIKQHLIMSQYKIMLTILKEERQKALEQSFLYATSNMEVAVYLSSMAKEEGITNHEILNEWIDLRERYYTYKSSRKEIKRTILLSSLFERISNNEPTKDITHNDLEEFQCFEQYDYHVNEFMIPPMTGDIFFIKGNYYLLVGQECELSIRNGRRKNPVAELIPITLVKNKDMGNFKEKYNYEKLLLGKFLDVEGQFCNISIDCTKREVIDNEILDLCSFNELGKSEINLKEELEVEAKYLLPIEWQHYYENLKERFLSLKEKFDLIKEHESSLGFNIEQLVNDMGASHNNRLVSIIDFCTENDNIKYNVKRICRIKNHVLLINKLFLEYRGRQGFNTINMDVGRNAIYQMEMLDSKEKAIGKNATVILTTSRKENSKIKKRDWIINKEDILEFIKETKPSKVEKYEKILGQLEENILLEGNSGFIENSIKFIKKTTKDDELLLQMQLLK